MTENIPLNLSEYVQETLSTHLHVGRKKPMSYLPIYTIERVIGITISEYRSMAEKLGKQCVVFSADESCIKSGAVYVYCRTALHDILESNRDLLISRGWPTAPGEFIKRIASEWLCPEDPILPVVKRAFGEG